MSTERKTAFFTFAIFIALVGMGFAWSGTGWDSGGGGSTFTGGTVTSAITFSNIANDITTGTNEDLTLAPNGTGDIRLGLDADTSLYASTTFSLDAVGNLDHAGTYINRVGGVVSTPAARFIGTVYSGGTDTTTKPLVLIEPTGTTSTAWDTNGTVLGINTSDNFSGTILDLKANNSASNRVVINTYGQVIAYGKLRSSIWADHPGGNNVISIGGAVADRTKISLSSDVTDTNTSGTTRWIQCAPKYGQTTGNASNIDFEVYRTGLVGSGIQRLAKLGTTEGSAWGISDKGHEVVDDAITGSYPALTSCGNSPALTAGSNDHAGIFTIGATGTGCTVTFGTAYASAVSCVVSGAAAVTSSTTTTALTVVAVAGAYSYHCIGLNE